MKTFRAPGLFVAALFTILFFPSCVEKKKQASAVPLPVKGIKGDKFTDILGAMEYEFNMLKNPVTGIIPDGIREQELKQAHDLLALRPYTGLRAENTFSYQGPDNLGGRTRALAYDIRYDGTSNRIILAGGVSGGLYKSVDDGGTWERKSPLGDLHAVSALAQDPRVGFRDTWYYSGGEFAGNSASATGAFYRGKGVFKSVDNGETWTHLPSSNTGTLESFDHPADYTHKIVVDPTNGNVYLAATDAIMRSVDGGTTWSTVLTSGSGSLSSAYVTDIVVTSTGRFYASFSGLCPTSPTSVPGVWTSLTGASGSWTKIAGAGAGTSPAGWNASGAYGRVVLAFAPSLESRVYALYYSGSSPACPAGAAEAEMYYWDDGLSTWTSIASLPNEPGCLAGNDPFAVQAGYDLIVAVKPDDPATIFIGGTNIYRSTTTGSSWTRIGGYASAASYALYPGSHPDIHAIAFSPTSSTTMLCANDGGIQRTTDNLAGSVSWTQINSGYNTFQYYYVDIDPRIGNAKVMGGAQDNGTTRNIGGTGTSFEMIFSGDGVSVGLSDLVGGIQYEYVGSQSGFIYRRASTTAPGSADAAITPPAEGGSGLFVTLFKLDPDNTELLYYANDNALYRTVSASTVTTATWTSMTGVAAAVTPAFDITALAVSRGGYSSSTSSLFLGTSGGKLFRLDDPAIAAPGTSPVDITGGSFPSGGYVSSVAVNPRNDDTVLVTFSNYGITNVWWTGNANSASPTWTAVEGGLSLPSFRSSAIYAIPNSPDVYYYVGTSVGLFSATGFPGTVSWIQEGVSDLGNSVVSSLSLRPSDANLLVGTHGHGMWKTTLSFIPLPVELTEFKGSLRGEYAMLEWTTASEYDSKYFELQRSSDGREFRKIATVQAAGNSYIPLYYSFTDREPLAEYNYYRLRSVDMDNTSELSSIVLIRKPGAGQKVFIRGNPFGDRINLSLYKAPKSATITRLIDASGRKVLEKQFERGIQDIEWNIAHAPLRTGVYYLQVVTDGKTFTRKLIRE